MYVYIDSELTRLTNRVETFGAGKFLGFPRGFSCLLISIVDPAPSAYQLEARSGAAAGADSRWPASQARTRVRILAIAGATAEPGPEWPLVA